MKLKDLINQKIVKAEINSAKNLIKFTNDIGESFYFEAVGDCCSDSWFEHVTGTNDLLKSQIISIEQVDLGEVIPTRQESDQLYSVKFGLSGKQLWSDYFFVEFRNSSNGYYGGYIEVSQDTYEEPNMTALEDF